VILHEFGHAIAYNGWADGNGNPPEDFYSVFDRWMLPGSPALFDGPNSVAAWGSQPDLTQNNIKHWGNPDNLLPGPELPAQEILWQDGTPVPLKACNGLHPVHAPPSSESPAGAPPSPSLLDQLMNGVSYYYQYRYYISELDIGLLQDVGLPLHDVVHKDGFEDSAGSP
jgi:hypothetical protein